MALYNGIVSKLGGKSPSYFPCSLEVEDRMKCNKHIFFNLISKIFGEPPEWQYSVTKSAHNTRSITEYDKDWKSPIDASRYERKEQLLTFSDRDFANMKIVASTEKELSPTSIDSKQQSLAEKPRKRARITKTVARDINISFTIVQVELTTSYEIEVEGTFWLDDPDSIKSVNLDLLIAYMALFRCKYSDPMYQAVGGIVTAFNSVLDDTSGQEIGKNVIARPRNIKLRDFSSFDFNGMNVGSPFHVTPYTLTVKADGVPKSLVVDSMGIWWIESDNLTLVHELPLEEDGTPMVGPTIIVGEYIENGSYFIPFDVLSYRGEFQKAITHTERMSKIWNSTVLIDRVTHYTGLEIIKKSFFHVGNTPESFADAYQKCLDEAEKFSSKFGNDGMILTPDIGAHNMGNDRLEVKKRKLATHLDILKIKPHHELTIDVMVGSDGQIVVRKDRANVRWVNAKIPVPDTILDLPADHDGRVLEVGPDGPNLKFKRFRDDKGQNPNREDVANDVWEDINNPITQDTFLNKDMRRLFAYSNVVKRNILSNIAPGCIIVDIGIGQGGDLGKYPSSTKYVVGIEPDDLNRTELLRRLKASSFLSERFHLIDDTPKSGSDVKIQLDILPCGGEDTDLILRAVKKAVKKFPNAPITIVSMLSMSFFWKSKELLSGLMTTLRKVAALTSHVTPFLFYTIEGHATKKFLSNGPVVWDDMFEMRKLNDDGGVGIPGTIFVKIGDAIVRGQEEYFVALKDLAELGELSYKPTTDEQYLSERETAYQSLFVHGSLKIQNIPSMKWIQSNWMKTIGKRDPTLFTKKRIVVVRMFEDEAIVKVVYNDDKHDTIIVLEEDGKLYEAK